MRFRPLELQITGVNSEVGHVPRPAVTSWCLRTLRPPSCILPLTCSTGTSRLPTSLVACARRFSCSPSSPSVATTSRPSKKSRETTDLRASSLIKRSQSGPLNTTLAERSARRSEELIASCQGESPFARLDVLLLSTHEYEFRARPAHHGPCRAAESPHNPKALQRLLPPTLHITNF